MTRIFSNTECHLYVFNFFVMYTIYELQLVICNTMYMWCYLIECTCIYPSNVSYENDQSVCNCVTLSFRHSSTHFDSCRYPCICIVMCTTDGTFCTCTVNSYSQCCSYRKSVPDTTGVRVVMTSKWGPVYPRSVSNPWTLVGEDLGSSDVLVATLMPDNVNVSHEGIVHHLLGEVTLERGT